MLPTLPLNKAFRPHHLPVFPESTPWVRFPRQTNTKTMILSHYMTPAGG